MSGLLAALEPDTTPDDHVPILREIDPIYSPAGKRIERWSAGCICGWYNSGKEKHGWLPTESTARRLWQIHFDRLFPPAQPAEEEEVVVDLPSFANKVFGEGSWIVLRAVRRTRQTCLPPQGDAPMTLSEVVFLDTETSGLDRSRHEVWEVALIIGNTEYEWQLPIDESKADLIGLNIGKYFERRWPEHPDEHSIFVSEEKDTHYGLDGNKADKAVIVRSGHVGEWCRRFQVLTHGKHIVGAVPSFDTDFLSRLMLSNKVIPSWHYHLIDVEALMVGYLKGAPPGRPNGITLPWKSDDLSEAIGIDPKDPKYAKHTALGDARWARDIYLKIVGDGD